MLEPGLSNFLAANHLHLSRFHAIRLSDILGHEIHGSISPVVQHRTIADGLGFDAKRKWTPTAAGCLSHLDGRVPAFHGNTVDSVSTGRHPHNSIPMAGDIGAFFTPDHLCGAEVASS